MSQIKKRCLTILICLLCLSCYAQNKRKLPVDYVNNFIGVVDSVSNCVIGPQLPHASISPSPQTVNGEHDGYNPLEPIRGFGQLQNSGTGWGTNGQIFFSPQIGLATAETAHDSPKSNEKATPYEYSVTLNRYKININISPSYHSAIYQCIFPKSDSSTLLIDITHNIPMDIKPRIKGEVSEGEVHFDNPSRTQISGYGIYSGGFGNGSYKIYFVAKISKNPINYGTWINEAVNNRADHQSLRKINDRVGGFFQISTKEGECVFMKIAISYKSTEQAKLWLEQEIRGWNYSNVKKTARSIWNKQLSKIEVKGGSEKNKSLFYTALYHANLMPRDRTNDTEKYGKNVAVWDDHFAVWDTWRTVYPLHMLINPGVVSGTINSFIARFKLNGVVKDAFTNGNDMIMEQGGNNVDNIIAEAYLKGIKGVNWAEAYQILKFDADKQRLGSVVWRPQDSIKSTYKELGWIPAGVMSCSMTLEYAYNDYCTAMVAKGLNKTADYEKYLLRSEKWLELWNPDAESDGFKGFITPKTKEGKFLNIDLKQYPGSWKDYFYEASSWNYSFFTPHQFVKLVELNGGKNSFADKLNYGFKNKLINYDNEPAFLAVYGFLYTNKPYLTNYWVHELMKNSFTEKGYPGNEDSGAMSSWYVFSSLGIFPNAGQSFYYLTGPLFKKIIVHLEKGKSLNIIAPNASEKNIYAKKIIVNGLKYNNNTITQKVIAKGCTIKFVMSDNPL